MSLNEQVEAPGYVPVEADLADGNRAKEMIQAKFPPGRQLEHDPVYLNRVGFPRLGGM
jgi:hypothetical protein